MVGSGRKMADDRRQWRWTTGDHYDDPRWWKKPREKKTLKVRCRHVVLNGRRWECWRWSDMTLMKATPDMSQLLRSQFTHSMYWYTKSSVMGFLSNSWGVHSCSVRSRSFAPFRCASSTMNFSCVAICWSPFTIASDTCSHSLVDETSVIRSGKLARFIHEGYMQWCLDVTRSC